MERKVLYCSQIKQKITEANSCRSEFIIMMAKHRAKPDRPPNKIKIKTWLGKTSGYWGKVAYELLKNKRWVSASQPRKKTMELLGCARHTPFHRRYSKPAAGRTEPQPQIRSPIASIHWATVANRKTQLTTNEFLWNATPNKRERDVVD